MDTKRHALPEVVLAVCLGNKHGFANLEGQLICVDAKMASNSFALESCEFLIHNILNLDVRMHFSRKTGGVEEREEEKRLRERRRLTPDFFLSVSELDASYE